MEEIIFEIIDQLKFLFFPRQWNNTFMDYSKNEVFALFLVYRKGQANMTEIADYLGIPLNTATGIVSRLEKRGVVRRQRDVIDKRIVTIAICPEGKDFLIKQLTVIEHYYQLLMEAITEDEKKLLMGLIGKLLQVISQDDAGNKQDSENKKKVKKIMIE